MKNKETKQSLYNILNISNKATALEIKKAFRLLAVKYHPDKTEDSEDLIEEFKEVQHAYSVLGDPIKKEIYDETGESNQYNEDVKAKFRKSMYESIIFPEILQKQNLTVDGIVALIYQKILELKKAVARDETAVERIEKFCKCVKKRKECEFDFLIEESKLKLHEMNMIVTNNKYQIELMVETKAIIAEGYVYNYVYDDMVNPHKMLMGFSKPQ